MIRRLSERGRLVVAVAAGALTLGLGGAGAVALTTVGAAAPTGVQVKNGGPDPCILAISYAHQWGICIQPPTN
jgi:hypothetical protein